MSYPLEDKIVFGVSYYPEHWPRERWPEDIRLMKEAGIQVLRLAELAWSFLEPEDGKFDFEWLDDFLRLAGDNGLRAVLGTPGEASPVWLRRKHPEIVRTDEFGRISGGRGMHCHNSQAFRRHMGRLTEAMAVHYAGHRAVIGWQIDNELRSVECYCPECEDAFREWLRRRYGTLERLNEAWGTRFWSQVYNAWEELELPSADRLTVSVSQKLDYLRFCSESTIQFVEEQARLIKSHMPDAFVTHNSLGWWYPGLDLRALAGRLDFIGMDSYPNVDSDNWETSASHDFHRSVKRGPYWIMEQKNGYFNYAPYNLAIEPGVVGFWSLQDIARGANGILYYRWRSNRYGAEQNPNGILRHDGTPRRVYGEIKELTGKLAEIGPLLAGTKVEADCAIVFSYDQWWAFNVHKQYPNFDYREHLMAYYKPLARMGFTADLVGPDEDLSSYRMVVVPAFLMLRDDIRMNLEHYAAGGGCLVITARSGTRTWENVTIDTPWPGPLSDLAGIRVDEFEVLPEGKTNRVAWQGQDYPAGGWLEMLTPVTAEPLAVYRDKFYAGTPAVTRHAYDQGTVYYVGVTDGEALIGDLMRHAAIDCGLTPSDLPEGVFVTRRVRPEAAFAFYMNATGEERTVRLSEPGADVLNGRRAEGSVTLRGYEVLIVQS